MIAGSTYFFLKHVGELRIIILRRKRADPVLDHLTYTQTDPNYFSLHQLPFNQHSLIDPSYF
jgi:hypothetical protein